MNNLINDLVEYAFPELRASTITTEWGGSSCFATISWTQDLTNIRIRCNKSTKKWSEPAMFGLLSHELSHPLQKSNKRPEWNADNEVINRGLGIYLAIERIITGKYNDHIIKRGKDRYLGYSSIRKILLEKEINQLDRLLREMRMIPEQKQIQPILHHDMAIVRGNTATSIIIDGHEYSISEKIRDPDIRIIDQGNWSYIYINDVEYSKFEKEEG